MVAAGEPLFSALSLALWTLGAAWLGAVAGCQQAPPVAPDPPPDFQERQPDPLEPSASEGSIAASPIEVTRADPPEPVPPEDYRSRPSDPSSEEGTRASRPDSRPLPSHPSSGPGRPAPRDDAEELVRAVPEKPRSASVERLVQDYLGRIKSKDVKEAEAAFRELWEVPRRLIPTLLRHVEDEGSTSMTTLTVIVFGSVAQQDVAKDEWVYYVPGLAGVKFDDLATGRTGRPDAFKVVLKRRSGFPVGAVVRAALLNRFRSPEYPREDDRRDPSGWWYAYYGNVRARL